MIVALTGSHSTGKSTLVEFFRGKEGFESIDSVTRKTITAKERRVDGVEDLNEAQLRILDGIKEAMADIVKKNTEDPSKVYLLDRCVFDFIAYTRCFAKKGLVNEDTLKRIEAECEVLEGYLDLVAYLDIEFKTVDDGIRSLDEDLRQSVSKEILSEILWSKVRAVKLEGSVLERVRSLQESIHKCRI